MPYTTRRTTLADLDKIAEHRYLMFADMGLDTDMLAKDRVIYTAWLHDVIADSNYVGLFIEQRDEVIAGAGMVMSIGAPLPTLYSTDLRRATIVNVYTHPLHRRKGIARQLVNDLIDIAREKQIPVLQLHASDAGRPLYESLGFGNTNAMRLLV